MLNTPWATLLQYDALIPRFPRGILTVAKSQEPFGRAVFPRGQVAQLIWRPAGSPVADPVANRPRPPPNHHSGRAAEEVDSILTARRSRSLSSENLLCRIAPLPCY